MLEKIKKSWSLLTVKVAVVALLVSIVSLYMPWFTYDNLSQTVMQAIHADPDFFVGALPVLFIAVLWVLIFFLINHPKLTLVGDAVLIFMYAGFVIAGKDRNLNQGAGAYLYLAAVIVCIICAFATKKQREEKNS